MHDQHSIALISCYQVVCVPFHVTPIVIVHKQFPSVSVVVGSNLTLPFRKLGASWRFWKRDAHQSLFDSRLLLYLDGIFSGRLFLRGSFLRRGWLRGGLWSIATDKANAKEQKKENAYHSESVTNRRARIDCTRSIRFNDGARRWVIVQCDSRGIFRGLVRSRLFLSTLGGRQRRRAESIGDRSISARFLVRWTGFDKLSFGGMFDTSPLRKRGNWTLHLCNSQFSCWRGGLVSGG